MTSLSSLDRAHACPASEVLPHVDGVNAKSQGGSAIHEYVEVLVRDGREAANLAAQTIALRWELDEREASIFYSRARSFTPDIPDGTLAEHALYLRVDGSVVDADGARGTYTPMAGGLLPGTIDLMWADPPDPGEGAFCPEDSTLWVVDLKTGEERWVPPIERNRQVRGGALLAARWAGAKRVIPAVCFVEKGPGRWDVGEVLEEPDLDAIEAEIRRDVERVEEQRARHAAGEPLELVTGPQCGHCPARACCPAQIAEVRALVDRDIKPGNLPLTRDEASRLATLLPRARKVVEQADRALRTHVEQHGAIPLEDGRVWGPEPATRDRIDTRIAYEELAAEVGDEHADAAFKTSKDAIEEAIGRAHAERGVARQKAPTMRRLLGAIRAREGITTEPTERWGPHYPAGKGGAT